MMLVEITSPAGALTADDRALLAERFRGLVLAPDHAPDETMRRARAMTHLAFRETVDWYSGTGRPDPRAAPPLLVTVTVPDAWREEVARHLMAVIRTAVHQIDASHGWERGVGDLWITAVGVPDGCIGLDGKPSTADDVLRALTEEYRAAREAGTAAPVPEGMLVDPVCGMLVRPGARAITLDHDGETVGFCALGCRDSYAREHDLVLA
ncbi:conserved hypothetical protein [Beutenbergia cavernae DSM 12333]|uniref:YHS domain protein n=1 Tax=Beutenbergia cavernae (strain ATCC BAA-8 / DSM 12333 / CCUG 43141 / JCM 11478 / NBRC 16432 / NCIMB 13614 / HKI 0122) TaxID=471853 RepID=C5C4V9_BEUC1|nr:hypothetical protein [Beutenbergia cavernae]ACQ80087.1 conserved hypothetical protein [Beutenbergia cavernae DSM 12333]